eukprot:4714354-Prorocentrum_lima.AAC.1
MEKVGREEASGTRFRWMLENVGRNWLRYDVVNGSPSPFPFPTIGSINPLPPRIRIVVVLLFRA